MLKLPTKLRYQGKGVFLVKKKEIKVITTKWLSVEFQSEKQNK